MEVPVILVSIVVELFVVVFNGVVKASTLWLLKSFFVGWVDFVVVVIAVIKVIVIVVHFIDVTTTIPRLVVDISLIGVHVAVEILCVVVDIVIVEFAKSLVMSLL